MASFGGRHLCGLGVLIYRSLRDGPKLHSRTRYGKIKFWESIVPSSSEYL